MARGLAIVWHKQNEKIKNLYSHENFIINNPKSEKLKCNDRHHLGNACTYECKSECV